MIGGEQDAVGADLKSARRSGTGVWKLPLVVRWKFSRRHSCGARRSCASGMWESRCSVRWMREREQLAHVSDHDLERRQAVEEPADDEAQHVGRGLDGEGPRGAEQRLAPLVDAALVGKRVARVQVERHVQRGDALPERQVGRLVVVARRVRVS